MVVLPQLHISHCMLDVCCINDTFEIMIADHHQARRAFHAKHSVKGEVYW